MNKYLSRILLADDDPVTAHSLASDLQLHGFEVEIVKDGNKVLQVFEKFEPDVILLDILLPGMNGFEICRQIRDRSAVPVIMITARDEETDRVQGLETGADDYVVKPFSFRELLARIRAILRRIQLDNQTLQNQTIIIGQITLDPNSRKVFRDQNEIEFSAREFDLLALLMRHVGQAISRGELLEKVWGQDSLEDYRTLFVHIHWLRMKIEDDPNEPIYIQNLRGFGYRFVNPENS